MTAVPWPVLTQRMAELGPTCLLDSLALQTRAALESGSLRDAIEPPDRRTRAALAPRQASLAMPILAGLPRPEARAGVGVATPVRLRDAEMMGIWARPDVPVTIERQVGFANERARVTGTVPRYLAEQLAVSDEVMPPGDPVVMSFDLTERDGRIAYEGGAFLEGDTPNAPREPVYAFAEPRAYNQALAALLAAAGPEVIAASPIAARAQTALRGITAFEDGPEPTSAAMRMIHRAAALQRSQAQAIARALGPSFDCRIDPQLPSMIDEPRERPIAEALVAAAASQRTVDTALLYAVASEDGLGREVERWRRGMDGMEIPTSFDARAGLGLASIADDEAALRKGGYLPPGFRTTYVEKGGVPTFMPAQGNTALANGLTYMAARLARGRELALAEANRLMPRVTPTFDARINTFLTLLCVEGGQTAVTRYLQGRTARPILPETADLRADPVVARAFARTAMWEQMRATSVFEGPRT